MSQQLLNKRIDNLDLIRAIAIAMVIIFHTVQMIGEEKFGAIAKFAKLGGYGVDLFFVLSGFLIGKLYWDELIEHGRVKKVRFILRRILRTYLPYIAALFLAFIAVWQTRNQPFDLGYLFFIQNYYPQIPFFLVSWSLCIEEHFYLFLPFILAGVRQMKPIKVLSILLSLSFIPTILRLLLVKYSISQPFGYATTATHFRFEGLILGVAAAHIFTYFPHIADLIGTKKNSQFIALVALGFIGIIPFLNPEFIYYYGLSIIPLLFFGVVLAFSRRTPLAISRIYPVKLLARWSYSIYLTHALVIHLVLVATKKINLHFLITWLLMLVAILVAGSIFYFLFEDSALKMRDKLVPKQPRASL